MVIMSPPRSTKDYERKKKRATLRSAGNRRNDTHRQIGIPLLKWVNGLPTVNRQYRKPAKKAEKTNLFERNVKALSPDVSWFTGEKLLCGCCDKLFSKTVEGYLCLSSGNYLRCYGCFEFFNSTEKLLEHYKGEHDHVAAKTNCPFCRHRLVA